MYCDDMNVDSTQMKGQENGSCLVDNNSTMDYSHMQSKKKKSPLRLGKKIYEFYNAPIVKFWFYTVSLEFSTCSRILLHLLKIIEVFELEPFVHLKIYCFSEWLPVNGLKPLSHLFVRSN